MFELKIETDNAAFNPAEFEVRRILIEVANKLNSGIKEGKCIDRNGNTVGKYKLK